MNEFDPVKHREMVHFFQERDDPTGWFDSVYSDAEGDHRAVFWADLAPNPYLVEWLKEHPVKESGKRAIAIGGLGSFNAIVDAKALTSFSKPRRSSSVKALSLLRMVVFILL